MSVISNPRLRDVEDKELPKIGRQRLQVQSVDLSEDAEHPGTTKIKLTMQSLKQPDSRPFPVYLDDPCEGHPYEQSSLLNLQKFRYLMKEDLQAESYDPDNWIGQEFDCVLKLNKKGYLEIAYPQLPRR